MLNVQLVDSVSNDDIFIVDTSCLRHKQTTNLSQLPLTPDAAAVRCKLICAAHYIKACVEVLTLAAFSWISCICSLQKVPLLDFFFHSTRFWQDGGSFDPESPFFFFFWVEVGETGGWILSSRVT